MQQKLVSVIIPNFNGMEFIKDTLKCVINQTHKNIEIIVIDDGSTDGSYEYISNLNCPNLTLVKNPSKGACAARNFGLSIVKGDYIQFLDVDDLLDADKIKNQIQLLESYNNKIAVSSTKHFTETKEEGIITDKKFLFSTDKPQDFLLRLYGGDANNTNMVAQHAWLVPSHVIEKSGLWDESLIKDQDGEFFCRVLMASEGIRYEHISLCYYRKHRKSRSISSGNSKEHFLSQLRSLDSKCRQLFMEQHTQAYRNAMALQYKLIAIDAYPQYKAVFELAINKSEYFGGSDYLPVLGGEFVEKVKLNFGWKRARWIRYNGHRLINFFKKL